MAKQKINLRVAGKAYQMTIDSDKEEVYRLAVRDVNANVGEVQRNFGDKMSLQDCLAITALRYGINSIAISRQNEMSDEDLKALDTLSQRLDKHLNRLSTSKKG